MKIPVLECLNCGALNTPIRTKEDHFDFKQGNYVVKLQANINVYRCECGVEYTDKLEDDARWDAVSKFLLDDFISELEDRHAV